MLRRLNHVDAVVASRHHRASLSVLPDHPSRGICRWLTSESGLGRPAVGHRLPGSIAVFDCEMLGGQDLLLPYVEVRQERCGDGTRSARGKDEDVRHDQASP